MTGYNWQAVRGNMLPWIVWALRILLGGVFVVSGLAKAIDLWGFIYKIEEYLVVWQFVQPRSLVVMVALGISGFEFTMGLMLMLGCYRRFSVWSLLAMMAVMLPLTLYIYIFSPVADCGCFGDFWVLSNAATFWKNVFITAGLICLLFVTRKVDGIYRFFTQWASTAVALLYIITVGLVGYNIQPLMDFRSFPPGSELLPDDEEDVANEYVFIYEKDGIEERFHVDNLPDSTWNFVSREILTGTERSLTEFAVIEDGENIADAIVDTDGEQLIIVLPQGERADVSYTYLINELWRYITARGGSLIEVVAIPQEFLHRWVDLSMASYPVYSGESTMLKELSRGVMSAVYLRDGKIVWKRSLSSIDADKFSNPGEKYNALESLCFDGEKILMWMTAALCGALLLLWFMSRSRTLFLLRRRLQRSQKMQNND